MSFKCRAWNVIAMSSSYLYGLACGLVPAVYTLARLGLDLRHIGSERSKPWIAGAAAVGFWFLAYLLFATHVSA